MKNLIKCTGSFIIMMCALLFFIFSKNNIMEGSTDRKELTLRAIGEIIHEEENTYAIIERRYQKGLYRLDEFPDITVVYWFDRNDNSADRAIMHVHPRGNPENPVRGVFATHAPVRPNLIGISGAGYCQSKETALR